MARLRPYLDHGILELDNNTAERAMRSVAIGRKTDPEQYADFAVRLIDERTGEILGENEPNI